MKVVRNDNNNPLSPAEMNACQQFEASTQAGQVLFQPQVAAGQPAPNCVALFDGVGRFGVTILEGLCTVEDGQWFRRHADGARSPMDNPLEKAWQAAKSVRTELKRELDLNTYVIAVAWFPDMDADEDILDETRSSSVRLFFGQADFAQWLVDLPKDDELQTHPQPPVHQAGGGGPEPRSRCGDAGAGRGATVRQRTGRCFDVPTGGHRQHLRYRRQRRRGRWSFADHRAGPIGQTVARALSPAMPGRFACQLTFSDGFLNKMADGSCPTTNQQSWNDHTGAVAASISSQESPRHGNRHCNTKLKPRWDVHLAGSFAGKLQPWIGGLSGSAVSPRLCGG